MRLITFFLIFYLVNLSSQNLVLNPSFEKLNTDCVNTISRFERTVLNWETANFGTTDIFNACSNNHVGVPKNYNGFQKAKNGNNYVGCYFYTKDNKNYREYIQGKLKYKLIKGRKYEVSFYISLADVSDYAIKNIDFYFSNRNVITVSFSTISISRMNKYKNFIFHFYKIKNKTYYRNKEKWIKLKKTITANGYEEYLTIGNFEKDKKIEKIKVKRKDQKIAYYYIDLVSVTEIKSPILKNKINQSSEIISKMKIKPKKTVVNNSLVFKINKSYVFKYVNFDFNSTLLKEKAKKEILTIYNYLKQNPTFRIEISGHTDNIGNESFNQNLSEQRAKSVLNYFIFLGLTKNRIKSKGYGKNKPLVNNTSENNRKINRRVEFKIIEN